jgi:hypothetical protein
LKGPPPLPTATSPGLLRSRHASCGGIHTHNHTASPTDPRDDHASTLPPPTKRQGGRLACLVRTHRIRGHLRSAGNAYLARRAVLGGPGGAAATLPALEGHQLLRHHVLSKYLPMGRGRGIRQCTVAGVCTQWDPHSVSWCPTAPSPPPQSAMLTTCRPTCTPRDGATTQHAACTTTGTHLKGGGRHVGAHGLGREELCPVRRHARAEALVDAGGQGTGHSLAHIPTLINQKRQHAARHVGGGVWP